MKARLVERLAAKVRRGEISERQLAARTGYTQPHIHNVLKGARRLRAETADALLAALDLPLGELLGGRAEAGGPRAAPVWRGLVGPRHRFPSGTELAGEQWFPASFLARFFDPVLLRVAAEEDGMAPLIEPGDWLLLDRSEAARRKPGFGGIYTVAIGSQGAVCRCQVVGSALVLAVENGARSYRLPEYVPLARRDVLDVVRGRVVWISRELT